MIEAAYYLNNQHNRILHKAANTSVYETDVKKGWLLCALFCYVGILTCLVIQVEEKACKSSF